MSQIDVFPNAKIRDQAEVLVDQYNPEFLCIKRIIYLNFFPFIKISPWSDFTSPAQIRANVVLPEPFAPTRPQIFDPSILKFALLRATTPSNLFPTFLLQKISYESLLVIFKIYFGWHRFAMPSISISLKLKIYLIQTKHLVLPVLGQSSI
jgi:hypothetical protein